jgi:hypothetical protein
VGGGDRFDPPCPFVKETGPRLEFCVYGVVNVVRGRVVVVVCRFVARPPSKSIIYFAELCVAEHLLGSLPAFGCALWDNVLGAGCRGPDLVY